MYARNSTRFDSLSKLILKEYYILNRYYVSFSDSDKPQPQPQSI